MLAFDNSYARMPAAFFVRMEPTPVAAPRLIRLNEALARELGFDPAELSSPEGVAMLAGNRVPEGAAPLAQAYAGHQFGHFTPQLGDGRAILLGEVIGRDGRRRDIQLKGSGPTPFSRRGDGRAALGPVLREYVVSEAFHALGIPSTRALAAVTTGEMVQRETRLPGGVLTRVAASHIRVGTFQFFAVRGNMDAVRDLADHVIARHYPKAAEAENRFLGLLHAVIAAQAALIAKWMLVGFIHGVMNTDNMAVSGETIDFGPCAFMDAYHPGQVYSSIDAQGRYAFGNQPAIAHWNLARLAETLLPLIDEDKDASIAKATAALEAFAVRYSQALNAGLSAKLGLASEQAGDAALANDLLDRMAKNGADFTLTFRGLCDAAADPRRDEVVAQLFQDKGAFTDWAGRWRERLGTEDEAMPGEARRERMRAVNPAFIPRNHLVEEVIEAGVTRGDFGPFATLVDALARPYEDQPENARFTLPPRPEQVVHQTFCGT